ncbi:MAG: AAA family ATPase [Saprospiraceae bacterium]
MLLDEPKKGGKQNVRLIYAFNGTGKTRLSREVRNIIAERRTSLAQEDESTSTLELSMLYYNSFTEDLFHWDNATDDSAEHALLIYPNGFTDWVLKDQGQDQNIIETFRRYTGSRATVRFGTDFRNASFSIETGDDTASRSIKISKGEESVFKWSMFYIILQQVVEVLSVAEPEERETREFDKLRYVFVDDPVSSLDDNHLIRTAVDLADLIRECPDEVRFIITTHNPLFFNVLSNEISSRSHKNKFLLRKREDGTFSLDQQPFDSPFAYHLHLKAEILEAIENNSVKKYHYNYLRNILEKLSTFLGYNKWEDLLSFLEKPGEKLYQQRMMNISSHSKHSAEEVSELSDDDKRALGFILKEIDKAYSFYPNTPQLNYENKRR